MPISSSLVLAKGPAGHVLSPQSLVNQGPTLGCEVRVDAKRAAALKQAGQQVPAGTPGRILVDTGASMTAIEVTLLQALGIPSVASSTVMTPQGQAKQDLYVCSLAFPGTDLPSVSQIRVLGANLKSQGIVGLLGRDLLEKALLVYDGKSAHWSIAF